MTLNELQKDVAALGFEGEIAMDELFIGAVNRSLKQIYIERGKEKIMHFNCQRPKSYTVSKRFTHSGFESEIYKGSCRAFSFRSYGKGEMILNDGFGERRYSFDGQNVLTRDFVKGDATFTFIGDFCYTVYNLTLYSEISSDRVSDISDNFSGYEFNGKEYDKSFLAFTSYPRDEMGYVILNATIDGEYLRISSDYEGIAKISYKYAPSQITLDDAEKTVEVPKECEHLLPLLVASYVWLDDDSVKSQYYLNMFREGMGAVKYYNRESIANEYRTNGWA